MTADLHPLLRKSHAEIPPAEVIGEVIGGIILGPSVLGLLWPAAGSLLFPATSLANLGLLSQIGLIVFMFVVGMELDTEVLTKRVRSAVLISHASIILPFLLGSLLALVLYKDYAPTGVPFTSFCLFMGISMSITAFPVLARMLHERGLSRSHLGTVALTCAAVDDLTAWCGLAVVAAISQQGTIANSLITTALCGLHIAAMLFVIRPLLGRWLEGCGTDNSRGKGAIAAVLFTVFFSAFMTEAIGIHALFGAFLAGIVMPKQTAFREALAIRLENFSRSFCSPSSSPSAAFVPKSACSTIGPRGFSVGSSSWWRSPGSSWAAPPLRADRVQRGANRLRSGR